MFKLQIRLVNANNTILARGEVTLTDVPTGSLSQHPLLKKAFELLALQISEELTTSEKK